MSEVDTRASDFGNKKRIFFQYALILFICFLIAAATAPTLWAENVYLIHTVLELIGIFISYATFLIVWNTYEKSLNISHIIGFGYLAVVIFSAFHTYYFFAADVLKQGYFDVSARYWMIVRLSETLVLFTVSIKIKNFAINKWIGFFFTVLISVGISLLVLFYPPIMPVMKTTEGSTLIRIILEYTATAVTIISLYNLRNNLNDMDVVSYRHIFMALLLIIPASLSFTLYNRITSFYNTFGHVLKIAYYYYLYRAVFVSSISYPYKRLEIQHKNLEEKNNEVTQLDQILNDLLGVLPIGILMYDKHGVLKYANRKFEELLECDSSKLIGLHSREIHCMLIPAKGNESTLCEKALENGGEIHKTIETFKTLEGNYIKLAFSSQRMKNEVVVLFSDVKKEQELENLQLQTQTILNAIEKLIVIVDKDNRILMCNKTHEEVVGISAKDIIGMDLNEHLSMLKLHMENEFEQDDVQVRHKTFEASITTASGSKMSMLFSTSPIYNIDGEVIGSIGVASDITELKEQQEKMMQQEKLALLGQMGAGIVHETRNYLTTIKGSCQLIDILTQEENIRNYTSKINKGIDEVNRIISEFLSLSRTREAELVEMSMYDITQSVKGIVETSSLIRDINIDFRLSNDERYLLCDEAQIKQVVLNLCKNAVEAMCDVENPCLTIESRYDEDKDEMIIEISDNGYGMSKDILKRIGTPFFSTKKNGTGVGLSVCYKIVKEHHGRIEVQSHPGKGTTFIIALPCAKDDEDFGEAI